MASVKRKYATVRLDRRMVVEFIKKRRQKNHNVTVDKWIFDKMKEYLESA